MQTEEFFLFDTVNTITAPALDPDTMTAVKDACLRYEKLFSRFDEQSQLFRINNAHGAPVDVDSELAQFIETSLAQTQPPAGHAIDINEDVLDDFYLKWLGVPGLSHPGA